MRRCSVVTILIEVFQTAFAEFGYSSGSIDGNSGDKSIEALRSFQRDSGLSDTGEPDPESFRVLITRYDKEVTAAHHEAAERLGIGGAAPATPRVIPKSAEAGTYLQQGDSSPEAQRVQERVAQLGHRPGVADGTFGAATASAILAFRKAEGLERDAIVGPDVLERLDGPQAAGLRSDGPGPRVEVELDRQIMFATGASGGITTITVSTGSGRQYQSAEAGKGIVTAHTPVGEFVILRRIDGLREAPLGTLYRPLYFGGGWAIHGNPHVPAYPASHGCVRTANVDQDFVFDLLGDGDSVWIYGKNPPLPSDADAGF